MAAYCNDVNFEQTDERREGEGGIWNHLSREEKIFSQALLTYER